MGIPREKPIRPAWVANLGAMIDNDTRIKVWCDKCRVHREFTREELIALAEKVGRDYALWNRRCRCRLTPACTGWNKFSYMLGVYRPLQDEEIQLHRMVKDG